MHKSETFRLYIGKPRFLIVYIQIHRPPNLLAGKVMIMAMCNTISHIFYFQRDKNKAYIRKKQKNITKKSLSLSTFLFGKPMFQELYKKMKEQRHRNFHLF